MTALARVRRTPSLVIGGAISAAIVLVAILGPWIATHEVAAMNMRNRFALPSAAPGWAPTISGATCSDGWWRGRASR